MSREMGAVGPAVLEREGVDFDGPLRPNRSSDGEEPVQTRRHGVDESIHQRNPSYDERPPVENDLKCYFGISKLWEF